MPQRVTKLRVFVASPSDVDDERAGLAQVVEELNRTVCVDSKLVLELVRWETHVAPELGRPQGVVNRQVENLTCSLALCGSALELRPGERNQVPRKNSTLPINLG